MASVARYLKIRLPMMAQKSAKGLLKIFKNAEGEYELKDQCSWEEEA